MSDAFDQIKKIKNEDYGTETHFEENTINPEKKPVYRVEESTPNHAMKNFVLKWGRSIIDFLAWAGVIAAVIILIVCICACFVNYNSQDARAMLVVSFIIPIVILFFTIVSNYFIYLLIDIRDSLNDINSKLK